MRNVALSPGTEARICCGEGCYDLLRLFGSQRMDDILKSRFGGLRINSMCYCPTDADLDQISNVVSRMSDISETPLDTTNVVHSNQDCLGMTPLHILACSSKQNLDLYRFVIASHPNSLITKDKWGCIPILYAIWGDAPEEITQFLLTIHKTTFPNHILDWDLMIETLCRAGVSLDIVKRLLDTQQTFFSDRGFDLQEAAEGLIDFMLRLLQLRHTSLLPEQSIDWQKAARELTIRFLVERGYSNYDWEEAFFEDWQAMLEARSDSSLHPVLLSGLQEIQQTFFVDRDNINLQALCEELVQQLKGWWRSGQGIESARSMRTFHFLVKCRIAERSSAIRVQKWRMNITHLVEAFPSVWIYSAQFDAHCGLICSKLIMCEFARDASVLLELAIWKAKIDDTNGQLEDDISDDLRTECRINCGANVIIPNVLSYLIGNDEESISSDGN